MQTKGKATLRFASLGSGSRGNATLVQHGTTTLLVDCGFSVRETEKRLQRLDVSPEHVHALLVTHEHQDHCQGIGALARKYHIPVYLTEGTRSSVDLGVIPDNRCIKADAMFDVGDIEIDPFTVPHDAAEPVQFVFRADNRALGLLTDTGMITNHIIAKLYKLDALLLECNHDVTMLNESAYPASLKQRVGSRYGHLNNDQAASLLSKIDCSGLQHVVAMHLSQQNNHPELARKVLTEHLDESMHTIHVADQETGLDWICI